MAHALQLGFAKVRTLPCVLTGLAFVVGCTSYDVHQSALVVPPVLPVQPTTGLQADAYVSDATVTFLSRPERAPSDESGLWVSRHVLQATATVSAWYVGARLTGLLGLSGGALAAAPTTLEAPDAPVSGYGLGLYAAVPVERHLVMATVNGTMLQIPSRYEATCVQGCEDPAPRRSGERHEILIQPSASLGYGYSITPTLRAFGAFALQNHPTNAARDQSTFGEPDVWLGPVYVTAGLGAEIALLPWLAIVPLVQWPLTRGPIAYGPFVGVGVRAGVPNEPERE